jgi:diguanylate cyclase (GGDEF)-like protein/PAS domain S-box-containing protein
VNFLVWLCLILFFVYLGVGFYVITHDPKSALNRIFIAVIMCSAIWAGAYSGIFFINISPQWAWFWFKVSSLGWITLAACLLHFGLVLTGKDRGMKKWTIVLLYLPAVVEIILINTVIVPTQAFDASRFALVELISPQQSWFWTVHTLYYFSYSFIFFIMVVRWARYSSYRREKHQANIIVVAGLVVLCSFVLTYTILPAFGHWVPWLVIVVGLMCAGAIVYAMKKYGLMILSPALVADDLLTRVTDMVLLVDRSGHIAMANNKAADILGYSIDAMQHMPLEKIIPQVERRTLIELSNQVDMNIEMEVDYQTARGELVPVKAYFAAVVDKFRDIVGILVIGQDLRLTRQLEHKIEEMDQVELALRESEAKYRDLFENANDLIYMHDLDGKFLTVNKATENLLGYSSSELVQFNTLDTVAPDQLGTVIETFNHNKNQYNPVYYEVSVINRYGERYELDVNRRQIYENGNLIYQCVARDVTERKRMEEKLKFLSMHDSLTGLYNRAYFSEELSRLESGRCDPVGIIVCDLDDLKKTNDSIGHDAGDEMIITAVRLIQSCFRTNDVIARIGGDEFAIVLPYSDEDVCTHLVAKMKSAVEEHNKISPHIIGVSAGFAVRLSTLQKLDEVLKQADQAMYVDKAARKKAVGSLTVSLPQVQSPGMGKQQGSLRT